MKTRHIIITGGLFGLLATAHCSSGYGKICENERNCVGGNDADEDACIEQNIATENVASAYDCDDAYDTYKDCLENSVCKDKRIDKSNCSAQSKAVSDCIQAATGRKGSSESSGGGGGNGNGGGNGTGGGNGNGADAGSADAGR